MQSTLTPEETDPHDVFEIAPGVVLASRPDHASATLAPDTASQVSSQASTPQPVAASEVVAAPVPPPVDATFRAASVDDILVQGERSSTERWMSRAIMSVFAMGAAVAAAAWQHYGDTAKHMITSWTPSFVVASSPPAQTPPPGAQPAMIAEAAPTAAQPAPAAPAATQALVSAPTQSPAAAAPPALAPTAAAPVPQDAAQLQSMTRDLASMGQQIEQLKANIAQLKAGQEQMAQQMSRDLTKASEAKAAEVRAAERSRISPLPPRPAAAAAPPHKPKPTFPPSPTPAAMVSPLPPPPTYPAAPAPPPQQATVQPDGEAVVRPPLPVR